MNNQGPLIIQGDHTMMLEVSHPYYADCRDFIAPFAELVKSPEFVHTYRITPLSLWNAASTELTMEEILAGLLKFSRYDIPSNILTNIKEWHGAFGKLILQRGKENRLFLEIIDPVFLERITHDDSLKSFFLESVPSGFMVAAGDRGNIKQALVKAGYPVRDICGYSTGDKLSIKLRDVDLLERPFALRDYQQDAVEAFYHSGRETGGSGVIVLPCGSGKTIIGLAAIATISNHTLIVTTNNVSVHQWMNELLSKTDIHKDHVGQFTGQHKETRPITITTYQMLTHRRSKEVPMKNLQLFSDHNWGLIIYDEVHLLPAPVFRATTEIQAKRRLGLTATLVREDGKEDEVFALIGPKRYDVPWKTLERRGYIAEAICTEYRIPMPDSEELEYAHAMKREQFRIASENSKKIDMVKELISNHPDDAILVIGQYISQLKALTRSLGYPLITGQTKHEEREKLYAEFKRGSVRVLIVSKVANFAVDLPDASVLIQVSGTFGSRQEEAQRLGRILRPKKKTSFFYTLVSRNTEEQRFALNRQLFLVEQGYNYSIKYVD